MSKILETNNNYHSNLAVGSTTLKKIHAKTILHAFSEEFKQSDAMILGSAIHCAILEPERLNIDFAIVPPSAPKKPTIAQVNAKKPSPDTVDAIHWWNHFKAQTANKTILDMSDFEDVHAIKRAVMDHPDASVMLTGGEAEYSYYSTDKEFKIAKKCRPDYVKNGALIDLKTTQDASYEGFARQIGNLGYHLQAAYYVDVYNESQGTNLNEFFFVAVETKAPYAVAIYRLDEAQLEAGRASYRKALAKLADFYARGGDPKEKNTLKGFGYPRGIIDIQVPFYMLNKISNDEVL